jgi:hypothetical protein
MTEPDVSTVQGKLEQAEAIMDKAHAMFSEAKELLDAAEVQYRLEGK